MYKSPIEMIYADIYSQVMEQQEDMVYKAVLNCVPNIDKEELIKALKYDRDQYEKGYHDGRAAGRWIPVSERLPDKEGSYLVCSTRNSVYVTHFHTDRYFKNGYFRLAGFAVRGDSKITHWMPLPEPPKGENGN
jgi:hypothetical protein